MKQKDKLVNFELLRILSMFLVIVGHYIFHGLKSNDNYINWDVTNVWGWANYISMELIYIIACIAVNCYIMITGYFCISKTEYRWNGIIKTILTTLFYSFVFLALAYYLNKDISNSMVVNSLLPIHQEQYWFVTAYVGLMMVAPFLSRLATMLNKRQYLFLLGVMFVLSFEYLYGRVYAGLRSIIFFSFLYLIAGYVRLYGISPRWKERKGLVVIALWIGLFAIATLTNIIFCDKTHFLLRSSSNDCMIIFLSFAVFVYFAYSDIKSKPLIVLSRVSPYVFGVYLVHDNPIFRKDLWNVLIPSQYSIPVAIHCLVVAASILILGVVIDYLRQQLFRFAKIDKIGSWMASKLPLLQ